jgi:hypothetical protein
LSIWKTLEDWTGWTAGLFVNDTQVCDFELANSTLNNDDVRHAADPSLIDDNISTTCLLKEIILKRLSDLQTCTEYLPESGRAGYSIFILSFQFLLPMITLVCAYYQICQTLRLRLEQRVRQRNTNSKNGSGRTGSGKAGASGGAGDNGGNLAGRRSSVLQRNDERRERNIMRLKRTIKLLCWIGAIFCICWLPLNIFNALRDCTSYTDAMSEEVFCGIYAVCHVLGMSSACANPVIYGFLNENFSKEFLAIGKWWMDRGKCVGGWCQKSSNDSSGESAVQNGRSLTTVGNSPTGNNNHGDACVGGNGNRSSAVVGVSAAAAGPTKTLDIESGAGGRSDEEFELLSPGSLTDKNTTTTYSTGAGEESIV